MEESIRDEPILIGLLVRKAILSVVLSALRETLDLVDLTDEQAEVLFNELGKVDLMGAYKNALIGERVFGLWAFEQARGNLTGVQGLFSPGTSHSLWAVASGVVWHYWFSNVDECAYLAFMRRQIDLADVPYRDIKKKKVHLPDETDIPRHALLTRMISMLPTRLVLMRDGRIADIAVAQVALAAEAYKSRFGSYPRSIRELKMKLGWKLPVDPFSGLDLRFKPKRNGYLVYSIGGDLKDDGGKPTAESLRYDLPGDIVWSKSD
jgi:hypothetical protein